MFIDGVVEKGSCKGEVMSLIPSRHVTRPATSTERNELDLPKLN